MLDKLLQKIDSRKTSSFEKSIKDTLKAFDDYNNKQENCMK